MACDAYMKRRRRGKASESALQKLKGSFDDGDGEGALTASSTGRAKNDEVGDDAVLGETQVCREHVVQAIR